jgi:MYXO-CTERM domain-containing protein
VLDDPASGAYALVLAGGLFLARQIRRIRS